jgi:branched-chain amino acid transport system substrate-binding protein
MITRRTFVAAAGVALGAMAVLPAYAQEVVKIGLVLPMTGPFASTGRQVEAGVKAYMAINGDTAGGKKVEVVLRDDAGTADQTRRIAQELVVNEGVSMLMGFGLTPLAMSVAPVLNQAKIPAWAARSPHCQWQLGPLRTG